MGDLSDHFSRREFACHCGCGTDTIDAELIARLELLREHFEKPITINSGIRCAKHNADVGGSTRSQHLMGKAADIVVHGYSPRDVVNHLRFMHGGRYGIGLYSNFTHFDVRKEETRWDG